MKRISYSRKPILKLYLPKTFLSLLLVSVLSSMAFITWVEAAGEIYVREGGSDTLCNGLFDLDYSGTSNCAFRTITRGISEVDTGGTVYVGAGTYSESVLLNRDITVRFNGNATITGNLSIELGTFVAPSGTLNLQGNYSRHDPGVFDKNEGTLVMNGPAQQSIGGTAVTSFYNLVINNSQHVRLDFNESIFMSLNLQNGSLILGTYSLELGPQAFMVGTFSESNMVVTDGIGSLCKAYRSNESVPGGGIIFTFPIGDQSETVQYTPANILLSSGFLGDSPKICARVVDQRKPENFYPSHLTRYWQVTSQNITSFQATVGFQYVSEDVVGNESYLRALKYVGPNWIIGNPVNTTTNNFEMTVDSFSYFTAGGSSTPIQVLAFDTTTEKGRVRVEWETDNEVGISGFYIHRILSTDPPSQSTRISSLIPSQGDGAYDYLDSGGTPGINYHYWLEVVPNIGSSDYFGPMDGIWYDYAFSSTPLSGGIQLDWSADHETGLSGFNLYRSTVPVKPSNALNGLTLIPTHTSPFEYTYLDSTAAAGQTYYYWLEIVAQSGYKEVFGPIQENWIRNSFLPIVLKN